MVQGAVSTQILTVSAGGVLGRRPFPSPHCQDYRNADNRNAAGDRRTVTRIMRQASWRIGNRIRWGADAQQER